MPLRWRTWLQTAEKRLSQVGLLWQDPELFGRNLSQWVNPALFEQRLMDVVSTPPMNVQFVASACSQPRLNVLDTAWTMTGMTGGPNTVINLAGRLARQGLAVRLVATVRPPTLDAAAFRSHLAGLLGPGAVPDLPVVSAAAASEPLVVGAGDVFLATHWRTAHQLKAVLPMLPIQSFLYMVQEYEAGFYPWSSNFALAAETYGQDFWPIINQSLLAEYVLSQPLGRLDHDVTRQRAVVFEPAVDARVFYPPPPGAAGRPKRLLFYARPTNSRNMFGLGLLALRDVAADPEFAGWEFLSIGSRDSIPDFPLGAGHWLRRAPWSDYGSYADLLRSADILLCPMLSPHTSYPVLEMVACGGLSITNSFATKTTAALAKLSPNIIAVPATMTGFVDGLRQGARMINAGRPARAPLAVAQNWSMSLDPVATKVAAIIHQMVDATRR